MHVSSSYKYLPIYTDTGAIIKRNYFIMVRLNSKLVFKVLQEVRKFVDYLWVEEKTAKV